MLYFQNFPLLFHHSFSRLFIFYLIILQLLRSYSIIINDNTLIQSRVENLRARYDHELDAIYIEWSYPDDIQNKLQSNFVVRYRITNRLDDLTEFDWKYSHVGNELEARLDLDDLRNGDELQAQVRAERSDGTILEQWSQSLLISISKPVYIDGISIDDNDLLPPLNFQAHILNPSMVRLEWSPPPMELSSNAPLNHYYIVNVKQLTSSDRTPLLRQQVKVQANSFTLYNLKPGQRYELTIRTALGSDHISNVAAIVEITMPGVAEDEYFEVGNLIISSHFKAPHQGIVNLTWEVPEKVHNRIQAYELQYSEIGTNDWQQLKFNGSRSSVTLTTLKSDTEYLLKIRTYLPNNLTTESGQFKFRTPPVVKNPIKKVDVIYTNEINSVRLHWTLENFVSTNDVDSYDVYISDNLNLPDSQWLYYPVTGSTKLSNNAFGNMAMNSLTLHDLQPNHEYYVRINIRKNDGELLRAPSIYRFKTLEHFDYREYREGNALSYQLLSPGCVQITWKYPDYILPFLTGTSIIYAESETLSTKQQWERINLFDPRQNSVVLEQLKPNSRYIVRILPRINNTIYDSDIVIPFEIRTGPEKSVHSDDRLYSRMVKHENEKQEENMMGKNEKLILNSCNPHSITSECLRDERCVPLSAHHLRGFCIPRILRDAIINN